MPFGVLLLGILLHYIEEAEGNEGGRIGEIAEKSGG